MSLMGHGKKQEKEADSNSLYRPSQEARLGDS